MQPFSQTRARQAARCMADRGLLVASGPAALSQCARRNGRRRQLGAGDRR
jgi:hypothetical protein